MSGSNRISRFGAFSFSPIWARRLYRLRGQGPGDGGQELRAARPAPAPVVEPAVSRKVVRWRRGSVESCRGWSRKRGLRAESFHQQPIIEGGCAEADEPAVVVERMQRLHPN